MALLDTVTAATRVAELHTDDHLQHDVTRPLGPRYGTAPVPPTSTALVVVPLIAVCSAKAAMAVLMGS